MKIGYFLLWATCYLLSLFPMCFLYLLSDGLYYVVYYLVGYRKKVVRKNLAHSFPEKTQQERLVIEKQFYAFLCDYVVETIKLLSISDATLKKRMHFEGVSEMVETLNKSGKQFAFIYLGHYGNWEWVSSLTARIHESDVSVVGGQIYHPLYNKVFDRFFLKLRSRSGGRNIPMKETLRYIVNWKHSGEKVIIGFISDQTPKMNSIHHWTNFLHQDTPVFTGTERIGKQVDALIFYADVERVSRGYYRCVITRMVEDVKQYPDFGVTDIYMELMEKTICRNPAYWLWSHNRWKRKRKEWEEYRKQ